MDSLMKKPWNEVLVFVECVPEDEAGEDEAEDCEHVEVLQARVAPKGVVDSLQHTISGVSILHLTGRNVLIENSHF